MQVAPAPAEKTAGLTLYRGLDRRLELRHQGCHGGCSAWVSSRSSGTLEGQGGSGTPWGFRVLQGVLGDGTAYGPLVTLGGIQNPVGGDTLAPSQSSATPAARSLTAVGSHT